MTKYIELSGYGNHKKHFIPIKAIADICFEDNYTSVYLNTGACVNVVEDENQIKALFDFLGVNLISYPPQESFFDDYQPDDTLPF
jgi:hypothetical protein